MVRLVPSIVFLFFISSVRAQDVRSDVAEYLDNTAEVHVVAFLDPECPISQKYTSTLNMLAETHRASNVMVYGIMSVQGIAKTEIDSFASNYNIKFACINDHTLKIAKALRATVTPEVFLLDKNFRVIYSGAIDDWFFGLGQSKRRATDHYLADAIERHIKGETPSRKRTEPVGCRISYTKLER